MALIRLWFTSALCDHQSIQLTLTAVAWSGNMERLHLSISLSLFLSRLLLSVLLIFFSNWPPLMWKDALITLHLPILAFRRASLVAFPQLQCDCLKPPLLSCFGFCHFAQEVAETGVNQILSDFIEEVIQFSFDKASRLVCSSYQTMRRRNRNCLCCKELLFQNTMDFSIIFCFLLIKT